MKQVWSYHCFRVTLSPWLLVALSHNTFDTTIYLGVCDKIVPGLVMAAATFGFLPAIFARWANDLWPSCDEKSVIRQKFATGEIDRAELMSAEMKSHRGPGTYILRNSQFKSDANGIMGLQLPGSSFVNSGTPLRDALFRWRNKRALDIF